MTGIPASSPGAKHLPIAVAIVARNAAQHLTELLPTLAEAAEVVVVLDACTSDSSVDVANSFSNTQVYRRSYESYADQVNWAISRVVEHKWVLIVDADERLDFPWGDVQHIVHEAVQSGYRAVAFRRRNFIGGRWIRHGGFWPDWQVRLISSDLRYDIRPVHPHVVVRRQDIRFARELTIRHMTYASVGDYLAKLAEYVPLEARLRDEPGLRHRPRYRSLRRVFDALPCKGPIRFIYMYVIRRGFLDGWTGYYLARWSAQKESMIRGHQRLEDMTVDDAAS